jgi:hypothetical protein
MSLQFIVSLTYTLCNQQNFYVQYFVFFIICYSGGRGGTFSLKFDVMKHWQKKNIMWYEDPLLGNDRK